MKPFYDPGVYRCKVQEQAWGKSGKDRNGNEQLVLKVLVVDKIEQWYDDAGQLQQEPASVRNSYERTIFLTFTTNNVEYIVAKLRHAGFSGTEFTELNLVGADVFCVCAHDSYQGQEREKWDLALPPRESKPLENDDNVARKVNALFGRALKENGSSTPIPKPPPVAASVSPADDDIPF